MTVANHMGKGHSSKPLDNARQEEVEAIVPSKDWANWELLRPFCERAAHQDQCLMQVHRSDL